MKCSANPLGKKTHTTHSRCPIMISSQDHLPTPKLRVRSPSHAPTKSRRFPKINKARSADPFHPMSSPKKVARFRPIPSMSSMHDEIETKQGIKKVAVQEEEVRIKINNEMHVQKLLSVRSRKDHLITGKSILPPNNLTGCLGLNTSQNLNVSSPAPVTTCVPSGLMAR